MIARDDIPELILVIAVLAIGGFLVSVVGFLE